MTAPTDVSRVDVGALLQQFRGGLGARGTGAYAPLVGIPTS